MKFEPEIKDLKEIQVRTQHSTANWNECQVTGYLLYPYTTIVHQAGKKSVEENRLKPLALTIVSPKASVPKMLRDLRNESFYLPDQNHVEISGRNYYRSEQFFLGEADLKNGGLQVDSEHIEGTLWDHTTIFRKDVLEVKIDPDGTIRGYILGEDMADIKLGLPRFFRDAPIPYLPEWEELLGNELFRRRAWSTKLIGFNMQGYALHVPQKEILGFLQEKARAMDLPFTPKVRKPAPLPTMSKEEDDDVKVA